MKFITLTHFAGCKMQVRADKVVAIVHADAIKADNKGLDKTIKCAVTVDFAGTYYVRDSVMEVASMIEATNAEA